MGACRLRSCFLIGDFNRDKSLLFQFLDLIQVSHPDPWDLFSGCRFRDCRAVRSGADGPTRIQHPKQDGLGYAAYVIFQEFSLTFDFVLLACKT